jgi:hypothetical protein
MMLSKPIFAAALLAAFVAGGPANAVPSNDRNEACNKGKASFCEENVSPVPVPGSIVALGSAFALLGFGAVLRNRRFK